MHSHSSQLSSMQLSLSELNQFTNKSSISLGVRPALPRRPFHPNKHSLSTNWCIFLNTFLRLVVKKKHTAFRKLTLRLSSGESIETNLLDSLDKANYSPPVTEAKRASETPRVEKCINYPLFIQNYLYIFVCNMLFFLFRLKIPYSFLKSVLFFWFYGDIQMVKGTFLLSWFYIYLYRGQWNKLIFVSNIISLRLTVSI